MSQFEQENDLGRGGGEVDDETLDDAWETREARGAEGNLDENGPDPDEPSPDEPSPDEPWAKTSSGDADEDDG